jgi:hypothetical protein
VPESQRLSAQTPMRLRPTTINENSRAQANRFVFTESFGYFHNSRRQSRFSRDFNAIPTTIVLLLDLPQLGA